RELLDEIAADDSLAARLEGAANNAGQGRDDGLLLAPQFDTQEIADVELRLRQQGDARGGDVEDRGRPILLRFLAAHDSTIGAGLAGESFSGSLLDRDGGSRARAETAQFPIRQGRGKGAADLPTRPPLIAAHDASQNIRLSALFRGRNGDAHESAERKVAR